VTDSSPARDTVFVRDLKLFARHGVHEAEAVLGQRFALDLEARLDLAPAGRTDDLALTVGYDAMIAVATEAFAGRRFALVEAAAEAVAAALLARFPRIERVRVEVRKPAAAIDAMFGTVGVRIERARA
jgi:7,8-dihydroneopterin aldolase/epimerase/oxygenase